MIPKRQTLMKQKELEAVPGMNGTLNEETPLGFGNGKA